MTQFPRVHVAFVPFDPGVCGLAAGYLDVGDQTYFGRSSRQTMAPITEPLIDESASSRARRGRRPNDRNRNHRGQSRGAVPAPTVSRERLPFDTSISWGRVAPHVVWRSNAVPKTEQESRLRGSSESSF